MTDTIELAECALFDGLDLEELAAIYDLCELETRIEGDWIFAQGDESDVLYVVLEGRVRISITTPGLGEEALAMAGPGDSFGELGLVDPVSRPRSANAIAQSDCCLVRIRYDALHRLFERQGRLGYRVARNLLRHASDSLRSTNQKLLLLSAANMFS